ncbi:MAG: cation-translocating P-type ATPase [Anaerolineales bacterium]|nr:cation-translocating P-type ATPase [Anaerolineales bacterium]
MSNNIDTNLPEENIHWHSLTQEELISKLNTNENEGLSDEEADNRLQKYGPNQLKEAPPTSFLALLWGQFNDFLIMLLIVAAIVSAVLGEYVEAGAIMAIVILNAVLGIVQERRAEQALAALKKMSAPDAQVIRNGIRKTVPSTDVVPGDVVSIEAGNYIPADIRLIESMNLKVEEAALTGESFPIQKDAGLLLPEDAGLGDRKNSAFMGTLVNYGRGKGVVTGTGMETEIGKIATMLQAVENEQTPLQKRLEILGKQLGWAALIICAVVFGVGIIQGNEILDMFMIAVSLAIAAVPEGLPAVVTISLALGMREMVDRNALIRRLSSVETLGSATTIGSDKTGTLTQNEMTVTKVWVDNQFVDVSGIGYAPQGKFLVDGNEISPRDYQGVLTNLWVGALNNDAELLIREDENGNPVYRIIGDPTEGAMIVAAGKAEKEYKDLFDAYPREQEIPFDSTRKCMTTIHSLHAPADEDISPFHNSDKGKTGYVVTVKGAPDVVLKLCSNYQKMDDTQGAMTQEMQDSILGANDQMAKQALRVLAMAYKVVDKLPSEISSETIENNLIFVGLQGMIDPPREEVKAAVKVAKKAGIRTVMITGDYPQTARAIAEAIGIFQPGHEVVTGAELNQMSDEELQKHIHHVDVFARVSPEHKVRIVQALRNNGEVVAMTGDGVNDAPALKQADIGVAMGITGTDVAKETADMVLTDDNYSSIVSAIEQGRVIYSNIRKFVYYLLSCNMAEISTIFIATLLGAESPLNPIQLLWLNLITDGAPAIALGMEKGDPDIMDQPPRPSDEPIINKRMRTGIVVQTIAITAVTLTAFFIGHKISGIKFGEYSELASTMAFVTLSFSELLRAFTARSERNSVFKIGVFKNVTMNWAVLVSFVLLISVIYVPFMQNIFDVIPLTLTHWLEIIPLLFFPSIAAEVNKWVMRKRDMKK